MYGRLKYIQNLSGQRVPGGECNAAESSVSEASSVVAGL